jgi:acetate---CoA ligase (ADP-forming)
VKLSAAAVQHKSELGGVAVGLDDPVEVRAAYEQVAALVPGHPGSVLVERMGPAGLELIVAAHREGIVPALMIGLGGIWTELVDDVVVVPLPADARRIERAIGELRAAALLHGARGRPAVDVRAAARLAQRLGELLLERGLETVECNPVLVAAPGQGAMAVDASVRRGRDA